MTLTAVVGATVTVLIAPIDSAALTALNGLQTPANQTIGGHAAIWAIAINSVGTLLLIVGTLVSIRRRRHVGPNLIILSGVIVIAFAGSLTRFGGAELLYVGQLAGLILLAGGMEWAGFTRSSGETTAARP